MYFNVLTTVNADQDYYILSASPAALSNCKVIDLSGCTILARRVLWVPSTLPVATASLAPLEEETSFIGHAGNDPLYGFSQSMISLIAVLDLAACHARSCVLLHTSWGCQQCQCAMITLARLHVLQYHEFEAVTGSIQALAHFQSVGRYDGAPMT